MEKYFKKTLHIAFIAIEKIMFTADIFNIFESPWLDLFSIACPSPPSIINNHILSDAQNWGFKWAISQPVISPLFLLVSVINMIAFIRWSSDKTCQLGWVLVKKYETILKKKYGRTHKTPTKQSAATNFMNHLHLPNTHNCDVLAWLEAERRAAFRLNCATHRAALTGVFGQILMFVWASDVWRLEMEIYMKRKGRQPMTGLNMEQNTK